MNEIKDEDLIALNKIILEYLYNIEALFHQNRPLKENYGYDYGDVIKLRNKIATEFGYRSLAKTRKGNFNG